MATKQEIDQVIESTDVVALVSQYVKLEKQGKNYKGLCPFHHEDTPSFVVSQEKKIAHCFGCNGGGNPIKFLMQIENISFDEALSRLAVKNGIKLSGPTSTTKPNPLMKYYQIMQTSQLFYKKYLKNTKEGLEALDYLHKRGLDDETIEMFQIGLAPSNFNSLYEVLKESNYLELDMIDVALVDKSDNGYYDLFTKRIMFPIYDEMGNVLAYSGRIFNNNDKNQPKYVNSRETIIFKKKDVLFNLNLAKGEIMKKKRVILHEGQMDVIASYRSGLKEAVCTMGTALSIEQAKMLKKYTNHAVICYDGDKAGVNASLKAINVFKSLGFIVHLVLLPNGSDPDEYVLKNGSEAYASYFESHMIDSNTYIFEQALLNKDLNDETVRESVKSEIFNMLASQNNHTLAEKFISKLAINLESSYESLFNDYQSYCNTIGMYKHVEKDFDDYNNYELPTVSSIKEKWNSLCELRLFMYAKSSKEKALYIDRILNDRIEALSFENQRLWIALVNSYYENFNEFNEGAFIKMLNQEDCNHYLNIIEVLRNDKTPYSDLDLEECLEKLKLIKIDVANELLNINISKSDNSMEQAYLISEKFKNKKQKQQLINLRRK